MLVLSCNLFVFDSVLFLQLFGVAMGTKVTPTFACIFMDWVELRMLAGWRDRGGLAPHWWRRYIDDILFLWRGTEEELIEFIEYLNTFHPTIKFKCMKGINYNFETRSVDFLDTTLWIDRQGLIQTTLYTKSTRVVQYLLPSSSHPSHITKNIPYSLGYRLWRIESTEDGFQANLLKLQQELEMRGYDRAIIREAFARVESLSREDTLEKVVRPEHERITLVIPFDKRLPNIASILHHRWKCLLDRDPNAKLYMPLPPRVSYSRTSSLRDIIVRSKVPRPVRVARRQVNSGFRKCNRRVDCSVCSHSVNTITHTCHETGEAFPITSLINCESTGLIYCISCVKTTGQCMQGGGGDAGVGGPQYIGCTARMLKTRFSEHVGSATQPSQALTTKPVGQHFRLPGHSHCDMRVTPVEKVRCKDHFVLEARESYWIKKYGAVNGLNRRA